MNITAGEALARLREGNLRFVQNAPTEHSITSREARADLLGGQEPFAVVLGCSDSRAPVEVVFDQGFGDLFVIRVAGNIVAPSQVGSIEFAAERFRTPLVVVLGHTRCGAIDATLDELQRPVLNQSPNLRAIVDRIRPAVEGLLESELRGGREALARAAMRANVRASVNHLRHGSALLENAIARSGLRVVGAEYSLETGMVEFYDGVE